MRPFPHPGLRPSISLGRRLRLAALAVAIGIPVFFSHTLLAHRAHELSDAEDQVSNAALTLKYHAARTIEVADGGVLTVARYIRDHMADLTPQSLHAVIREQIDGSRGIGNILVTNRDGVMIADGIFPTRHLDLRDRDYFQSLRDDPRDRLAIGRPIIGKLSNKPVLPVARRLVGSDGAFAGIVQTSLDVGAFQEVYDAVANGDGGVLSLWRTDGTLLVRSPQAPDLVGRTMPTDAMYGERAGPESGKLRWMTSPTDGDEQVVALSFLDGHPIYVGSALRKEEVLAPWYRLGGMQGAIGGGLTILVVTALLLLAREIERRQATDARIRLLAENATDIFIIGDLDGRPEYVSPAVRTTLGYEPEEMIGIDQSTLIHVDDHPNVMAHWSRVLAGNDTEIGSARHRHRDGHYLWLEASVSLTLDPVGGRRTGFVATLRDVTERREAEDRIRHMALHDALTGLPNRALFHDRLDQAIALAGSTGGQLAVLACDLDRFKAVNDSLGHPAGDALLLVAAERMQAVLHPRDTVARLGGDEFAVVLAELDATCSVTDVALRLIAAVGEPVDLDGRTIEVGLSIGYTIATGDDANADELFKRADMALYEAKSSGRSTHRAYQAEDGARIATRGRLGLDMKESIRRGEFRLVYQPVVHAVTGAVLGMEALMRWRHPVRGEVSPGEFIPLAEETGLIVPLGEWALREACREATGWPPGLHVAVNVSPIQFRRPGLEQAVLIALGTSGLSPGRLVIEITESLLMDDSETAIAGLHRLRTLGVQVALDDFGTGYSSLGYLRRFPFDKIKIDRSFIRDIADPDAAAIVRAVAGIGERLGMAVVAEGVETTEQLALVQQEGCTSVQGFLFSRPLPAEDARAYVAARREEAA